MIPDDYPHYFQPDYSSLVQYNKQTGGKSDLSLDLGRLLKFRPSKIDNLEEGEGKSPSLFVDLQAKVRVDFKPERKPERNKVNHFYFNHDNNIKWFTM